MRRKSTRLTLEPERLQDPADCFRQALQALVTETQRDVTGIVRLKLYKGNIIVAGRKSPKSLYDPKIATMEGEKSSYDQSDATGFIRLNALRLKVRAALTSD